MNPIVEKVIWVIIVSLLFVGIFLLLQSISFIDAARRNMNRIMGELHKKDDMRVKDAELKRRRYGTTSGSGAKEGLVSRMLKKVDDKLVYSEFSIQHAWLNASVYLIFSLVAGAGVLLLGLILVNLPVGILLAFTVVIGPYAYLTHQANKNYHNTEMQLQFFINLVASNSVASSDIMTVLEMSAPYVSNPIKGAIYRAISTARLSGKSDDAVWQLTREIEHPIFVNFIRNLDICAKHDADFRSVAKDFALQADQQVSSLEKLRAIFDNARNEILLMIVVGVVLSFMVARFCGLSLFSVLEEMTHSAGGMICITIECLIYACTAVYVLLGRRR